MYASFSNLLHRIFEKVWFEIKKDAYVEFDRKVSRLIPIVLLSHILVTLSRRARFHEPSKTHFNAFSSCLTFRFRYKHHFNLQSLHLLHHSSGRAFWGIAATMHLLSDDRRWFSKYRYEIASQSARKPAWV